MYCGGCCMTSVLPWAHIWTSFIVLPMIDDRRPVLHRTRPWGCGHRPSSQGVRTSVTLYTLDVIFDTILCAALYLLSRLRQCMWNWSNCHICVGSMVSVPHSHHRPHLYKKMYFFAFTQEALGEFAKNPLALLLQSKLLDLVLLPI